MAQLETNGEWYREAPWDGWNPAKVPAAQKEKITFSSAKETASTDGLFDVARRNAGGKRDMDVFLGWEDDSG